MHYRTKPPAGGFVILQSMKTMFIMGGIICVFLALWLGWTYYASGNLETPTYTVSESYDYFEVREYDPYLIVQVTVEGDFDEAINQGFRILAGYIFGGNVSQESIKMTAPVTETESVKIEMTAPVTETGDGTSREVAFVVPSKFTLETLPIPNDDQIKFAEVPAKTIAAHQFSFYAGAEKVARKKEALLNVVIEAGLTPMAPPTFAAYNDPWSFPALRRNEVWVEVE